LDLEPKLSDLDIEPKLSDLDIEPKLSDLDIEPNLHRHALSRTYLDAHGGADHYTFNYYARDPSPGLEP
jgi:hypothetical protein